jgi:3-oxoacyl-[acyl-carrier-protein] synthase-3
MSSERVGILGVGAYVPKTVRTQDYWSKAWRQALAAKRPKDVTSPDVMLARARSPAQRIQFEHMLETYDDPFRGTHERRILEPQHAPSYMEIEASKKALLHANIDPIELDAIIIYSMPSDNAVPGNGGIIQGALGAKRAQTLGVDSACASFLSGFMVGELLIRTGQASRVLVVNSGAQARVGDPNDPAVVNFGDGAGAAVLGPVPAPYGFVAHAIKSYPEFHKGICVSPNHDEPWYQTGGPMYLHSRHLEIGKEVVSITADMAVEAVETVLRRAGLEKKDITHWYSHQPVSWFNAACRTAAGLAHAQTTDTFRQYAGMGPANIGVNLDAAVERNQLKPGDKVMLFACGAGYLWAATVVTWGR